LEKSEKISLELNPPTPSITERIKAGFVANFIKLAGSKGKENDRNVTEIFFWRLSLNRGCFFKYKFGLFSLC
jgi:hypothetical protein